MNAMPEITLRDYFAGLAMQGELSSQAPDYNEYAYSNKYPDDLKTLALKSYAIADAMLAARGAQETNQPQEKTCEWTIRGGLATSPCNPGFSRFYPSDFPKHCDECGGRIVVKEKRNER
jgi:hypothetical protein